MKNINLMQKRRVGILVTHEPITLVNELINFGEMMCSSVTLDLVIGYEVPKALNKYYNIYMFQYGIRNKIFEYITEFLGCLKYVRQYRPNVLLQFTNPQRAGLINAIVGKLLGIKVIVEMTGETFYKVKVYKTPLNKLRGFCSSYLCRLAYALATKIMTYGPILKSQLIIHGFKPEKIVTIPPAINLERFKPSANKSISKLALGLPSSDKVALYIGRLDRLKGADRLECIIRKVIDKIKGWTFVIVGSGNYYKRLKEIKSEKVKLFGEMSPLEIDQFYKAADLVIFPSRTEGLPNVILEALTCGVPVISSGVGEIPSFISNICNSIDDYVSYIINESYILDKLPEYFRNGTLKDKYIKLVNSD